MSQKLDRILDALEIIGQQIDAMVEATKPLPSIETALNIQNKSVERNTAAMRGIAQSVSENTSALQALRRDVEELRKNGCDRACNPDDPDTSPAVPQIRALGVALGGE